ncbi:MAG: hypothetical protein Q7R50_01230 [Dehalococcoidales bacterium]|nr:hypothetical protein [Dehalococcoidales bacterium]
MTMTAEPAVSKGTILVVTRDPEFQRSAYGILGNRGYSLYSTESVGRGLKNIVSSVAPNLAIIDMMPLLTGIKITLRMHRWAPTRTVLVGLWESDKNCIRRLDLEAPEYLSAPISAHELFEWVETLIAQRARNN